MSRARARLLPAATRQALALFAILCACAALAGFFAPEILP